MLLSIIIPVYNAEKTLYRTFQSLNYIDQKDQRNTEIIFIDDGSQDKSFSIIRNYQKSKVWFRILLFHQNKNIGAGLARNQGLSIASGKWIFFLDADDEINLNLWTWIKKYPQEHTLIFPVSMHTDLSNIKTKIKPINSKVFKKNYYDLLSASNPFTVSSVVFKKSLICHLFMEEYYPMEDWLFWWMNSAIFKQFKLCSESIATIHIHEKNMTANQHRMGEYRQKVAQWILKNYTPQLTQKQKNNLLIQKEIGKIQTGQFPNLLCLIRFPCTLTLYIKLFIYLTFHKIFQGQYYGKYFGSILTDKFFNGISFKKVKKKT